MMQSQITLHTALSHLDKRNTYVMLFIDYRPAFNTIVTVKLITKLRTETKFPLQLDPGLPDGHSQVVRVGNNTSDTLILNTRVPQGCVLSPLLYTLFTHYCVAKHDSSTSIQF